MKALKIVGGVVALQLVLVGLYVGIEGLRTDDEPFAMEALDEPAPALVVHRAGGLVQAPDAPHLVHFWATWCAPCVDELPGLVAAAEESGVPLLAVTDEPWSTVERWFEGDVPIGIVLDESGSAAATWGVHGLPDTFVVQGGRVVGRMGGPRDWQTSGAQELLSELRRTR